MPSAAATSMISPAKPRWPMPPETPPDYVVGYGKPPLHTRFQNGRRKKITKREAIVTQLVNKSASADLKATQIVLALLREVESQTDGSADPAAFTEADQQIIRRIQARLRSENG